ncbi:hypothetical protein ACP275_13G162700 [Erythranthe tilingii]
MDSDDFWTARIAAAKRQLNHRHLSPSSQLDGLMNMEDLEARPEYPCPYCYEEIDALSFCSHLQADHSSESTHTVCPICSVKVSGNILSHITIQHGHLFKLQRRRPLGRFPISNSQSLSLLGRDLREAHLQVLLGGASPATRHQSNSAMSSSTITDKFLSSLASNLSASESDEISKSLISSLVEEDDSAKNVVSEHMWKSSYYYSLSREEREKRMEEAAGRAVFVQDLFFSTILAEL